MGKTIFPRNARSSYTRRAVLILCAFLLPLYLGTLLSESLFQAFRALGDAVGNFVSRLAMESVLNVVSTILAAFAGLAIAFTAGAKIARKDSNPLFATQTTLLAMIMLVSLARLPGQVRGTLPLVFQDASGISQLIFLIMVLGLAIIVLQFFYLRGEYNGFLRIRERLASLRIQDEEHFDQAVTVMHQSTGLLRSKWENLRHIFEAALHADYDMLISFPDQQELLKESKISFIIKILPIFGMIGTILGFTLAVVGMQTAATNMSDFSTFKGNLLDALGGMKVAFVTTLTGLVAMAMVMWLNTMIEESRRRILLMEAEFLYLRLFLPWQKIHRLRELDRRHAERPVAD